MRTLRMAKPALSRFRNWRHKCVLTALVIGSLFAAQVDVSADVDDDNPGDVRTTVRNMLVSLDRHDADAILSHLYFADPEHVRLLTKRLKQVGVVSPTGYQVDRPIHVVSDEAGPFRRPGQYLLLLPLRGDRYRAQVFQIVENDGKLKVLFEPKRDSIFPQKEDAASVPTASVDQMRETIIKMRIAEWQAAEGADLRWMVREYLNGLQATRRAMLFAKDKGIALVNGVDNVTQLDKWIHELDEMASPKAREHVVNRLKALLEE